MVSPITPEIRPKYYILIYSLDFARNLCLFPPSIQEFYIQFDYKPPSDERYSPAIVAKGDEDMFSSHLCDFSQQLTSLEITRAVLGRDLFWPLNTDKTLKAPFWDNQSLRGICASHATRRMVSSKGAQRPR